MSAMTETGAVGQVVGAVMPEVNSRVGVRVDECCRNDLMTRVENVLEPGGGGGRYGSLTVAAPVHPCGLAMPYDRTPVHVRWTMAQGAIEVPAQVSGTTLRPIALWRLEATGPAVRVQRRRYVRVATQALPVELRAGEERVTAWLADVSEGGLRCRAERWVGSHIAPGDQTVTWLKLGEGLNLALPAQIVRVSPAGPDHVEIACQFMGIPDGTADQLRRYVFSEQLRQRRKEAGLDA